MGRGQEHSSEVLLYSALRSVCWAIARDNNTAGSVCECCSETIAVKRGRVIHGSESD